MNNNTPNFFEQQSIDMLTKGRSMMIQGTALMTEALLRLANNLKDRLEKITENKIYNIDGKQWKVHEIFVSNDNIYYETGSLSIKAFFIRTDYDSIKTPGATDKEQEMLQELRSIIERLKGDEYVSTEERTWLTSRVEELQQGWKGLRSLKHRYELVKILDWQIKMEELVDGSYLNTEYQITDTVSLNR